jgi:serine/threonine-protein kinase
MLGALALGVLTVFGGAGILLGSPPRPAPPAGSTTAPISITEVATSTTPAPTAQLTADQQRVLNMVPPGYPPGSCRAVANPAPMPDAIAALDCYNNTNPGGPALARYTLLPDVAP